MDHEVLYLRNGIYRYDIDIDTMRASKTDLMDTNFDTVDTKN